MEKTPPIGCFISGGGSPYVRSYAHIPMIKVSFFRILSPLRVWFLAKTVSTDGIVWFIPNSSSLRVGLFLYLPKDLFNFSDPHPPQGHASITRPKLLRNTVPAKGIVKNYIVPTIGILLRNIVSTKSKGSATHLNIKSLVKCPTPRLYPWRSSENKRSTIFSLKIASADMYPSWQAVTVPRFNARMVESISARLHTLLHTQCEKALAVICTHCCAACGLHWSHTAITTHIILYTKLLLSIKPFYTTLLNLIDTGASIFPAYSIFFGSRDIPWSDTTWPRI